MKERECSWGQLVRVSVWVPFKVIERREPVQFNCDNIQFIIDDKVYMGKEVCILDQNYEVTRKQMLRTHFNFSEFKVFATGARILINEWQIHRIEATSCGKDRVSRIIFSDSRSIEVEDVFENFKKYNTRFYEER